MTKEEAVQAMGLMEHVESIVATYEPGEKRNDTTLRELKEACRMAIAALRAQPTPDCAHGDWQGEGDGYADGELVYDVWHCSCCGHIIDDRTDDPELLPNYCPNCGAKMDGDVIQPAVKLDRNRWAGCETCRNGRYRSAEYCPGCGRPLTGEAWAKLERRIGGNDEKSNCN